jgi:hypothetical protein
VKRRKKEDQEKWMATWNAAFTDTGSETHAYKAANGAIQMARRDLAGEVLTCFASDVFPGWEAAGVYKVQMFRSRPEPYIHEIYGELLITNADLAQAVRNYRNSSRKVFLDYNHGVTSGRGPDECSAIGWCRDMYLERLDGTRLEPNEAEKVEDKSIALFAEFEVNADANERIRKREYALFSPTFQLEFQNEETGEWQGMTVLGGAATNIPYFSGMQGFIALEHARDGNVIQSDKKDGASSDTQVGPFEFNGVKQVHRGELVVKEAMHV